MAKLKDITGTVDDPTIIFTKLDVDGEIFDLAWEWGAIAKAEKQLGEWVEEKGENGKLITRRFVRASLLTGIGDLLYGIPGIGQIGELLYAAMLSANPQVTLAQAGKLVRIDTVADIKNALLIAWGATLPDKKAIRADPSVGGGENV